MPKQQFLSRDNKGWKLRRRVPARLQDLAGKTQWVERLSGLTRRAACERANIFGVKTDAEIKRLSNALRASQYQDETELAGEPRFTLQLTNHEIDQIAIAYFHELEQQVQNAGGYRKGVNSDNRDDVILDLAMDHAYADAVATGHESATAVYPDQDISTIFHLKALKQLVQYGFLERSSVEREMAGRGRNKGKKQKRLHVSSELETNAHFQRLAARLAEAQAEIARRRLEANTENRHPSLQNPLFERALTANASSIIPRRQVRLADLIDSYLGQRKKEVGPSRYDQLLTATRALEEEIGRDRSLLSVTRDECQEIAGLFVEVPAWVTRHYKGLSLRQASEAYRKKHGQHVQRHDEARKHLAVLREIFEFAVDKEWLDRNPAQRVKIVAPARPKSFADQEEGYEPFTIEELKLIFNQPLYTGCKNDGYGINRPGPFKPRRSRFWLPLIALYSGMRMQEILQLERSDIREAEGIPYFSVNDKQVGEDYTVGEYTKRLKTKNSLRQIPIHPELLKFGFLDFVASAERQWLFPDMPCQSAGKMSDQFSKRFRTFLKPTGISTSRRKVFHSFRNTLNDALRAADVGVEHREPIMGWVDYKRMDSRYGAGHLLSKLNSELSNVSYPGLDLSHIYQQ